MNVSRIYFRYLIKLAGPVFLTVFFFACDVLEDDIAPDTSVVDVTGTEIYTLPGGMAYIDLYAMVKTTAPVRLSITSQPARGVLRELQTGFLQYVPNSNFKSGRDGFQFSVYSTDNKLLKQDSVIIIIETDSTQLPCGIYPGDDYIEGFVTAPITVSVLDNDILCPDSSNVKLEIYHPVANFPPFQGTADVVNNRNIHYVPNAGFQGADTVIYKVTSLTDTTKVGYGMLVLSTDMVTPFPPCEWVITDDFFTITRSAESSDTIFLPIFKNDTLCSNLLSGYTVNIVHAPVYGRATVSGLTPLRYVMNIPDSITSAVLDSLVYQVCYDTTCRQAKTVIDLNP